MLSAGHNNLQVKATSSIPSEFPRKLATLIREYTTQLADVHTLRAMLTVAEQGLASVDQWEDALEQARQTPEYRNISEQYEPLLLRLEHMADIREVENLLATMPQARKSN
jgi:hypothetical protein